MNAPPLDSPGVDDLSLARAEDRAITFVYRAALWCVHDTDEAERRTQAVFDAAPELLGAPDLDDDGYRARLVSTFLATMDDHRPSCRTAITHAAYFDQRDLAAPAQAHLWDLLVRALADGDAPTAAIAAVTVRTNVHPALVHEEFVHLLKSVSDFTHVPCH